MVHFQFRRGEVWSRSMDYETTPPKLTHQKILSKPLSIKLQLSHSLPAPADNVDQTGLKTSWSEAGPQPAPPLLSRGCTPDKRDSNTNAVVPPAPPKRLAHKRNTEWSTDDDSEAPNETNDLRDSGISTASLSDFQSNLNNLNNLGYEDFDDIMNISPSSIVNVLNVSTGNFTSGMFQGKSLSIYQMSLPPIPPKAHQNTPAAASTLEDVSNRTITRPRQEVLGA